MIRVRSKQFFFIIRGERKWDEGKEGISYCCLPPFVMLNNENRDANQMHISWVILCSLIYGIYRTRGKGGKWE